MCMCHTMHVEVKGQLGEIHSLHPLYRSWESNPDLQAWSHPLDHLTGSSPPPVISLASLILLLIAGGGAVDQITEEAWIIW